jgi:predicted DNA-binding transcriptional regulator YafY
MAVFQKIMGRAERLKTVDDLFRVSPPLSFQDSGTFVLEPPAGYEDLGVAIREERTVELKYDGAMTGIVERRITPRGLMQTRGRAYLTATCHLSGAEKTYRLDRIREIWIVD